jgi:hypothetical protein
MYLALGRFGPAFILHPSSFILHFGVALGSHWGGFGGALGSQWGAYQLAINRL